MVLHTEREPGSHATFLLPSTSLLGSYAMPCSLQSLLNEHAEAISAILRSGKTDRYAIAAIRSHFVSVKTTCSSALG